MHNHHKHLFPVGQHVFGYWFLKRYDTQNYPSKKNTQRITHIGRPLLRFTSYTISYA